jgi:hypothetical protein
VKAHVIVPSSKKAVAASAAPNKPEHDAKFEAWLLDEVLFNLYKVGAFAGDWISGASLAKLVLPENMRAVASAIKLGFMQSDPVRGGRLTDSGLSRAREVEARKDSILPAIF